MEPHEKNHAVARIVAGITILEVEDKFYMIRYPTLEQKYISEEIYRTTLNDALASGLMSEDDLLDFLLENSLWSEKEDDELKVIEKDIEELKIKLYENYKEVPTRELMRSNLLHRENLYSNSFHKRHAFDHLTGAGLAQSNKYKFLMSCSIYRENGKPLWKKPMRGDCFLVDKIVSLLSAQRLSSANMRELSRTHPWREYWAAKKYAGAGVFGKAAVDLTDDQRSLYLWSLFYDNIYENPERPSDEIINDDPACDGFMILQGKKDKEEKKGPLQLSQKALSMEEVFVPLVNEDTGKLDEEKARALDDLNSPMAKAIMRSRFNKIEKQGIVNEIEFGDVQNKLRQQIQDEKVRRGL